MSLYNFSLQKPTPRPRQRFLFCPHPLPKETGPPTWHITTVLASHWVHCTAPALRAHTTTMVSRRGPKGRTICRCCTALVVWGWSWESNESCYRLKNKQTNKQKTKKPLLGMKASNHIVHRTQCSLYILSSKKKGRDLLCWLITNRNKHYTRCIANST